MLRNQLNQAEVQSPFVGPPKQGQQDESYSSKLHDEGYRRKGDKPFLSAVNKPTEEEKQSMIVIKPSAELNQKLVHVLDEIDKEQNEKWLAIKHVVNDQGTSPDYAILNAVRNDRIVVIGEQHTFLGTNPARLDLARMIPVLKENGATHLAVELPASMQIVFDEFEKFPGIPMAAVLDILRSSKMISQQDNDVLMKMVFLCPDLELMWNIARNNGLKLVCVDENNMEADGLARERYLANSVMNIVRQNEKNKVIFCTGNLHAIDTKGKAPKEDRRAAELLRQGLQPGETMTTFVSVLGGIEAEKLTLYPLAKSLSRPVAIPTRDENGEPNAVADVNMLKIGVKGMYTELGYYDQILLYPPMRKGTDMISNLRFAGENTSEPKTVVPDLKVDSAQPALSSSHQGPKNAILPDLQLVG